HGTDVAVDTVEIGTGDDDTFTALHDGDPVTLAFGGQGASVMPVRIRLSGAATPSCLTQSTTVAIGQELLGQSHSPLKTYAQTDGTSLTKPDYIVLERPPSSTETFAITVAAGQRTVSVQVQR